MKKLFSMTLAILVCLSLMGSLIACSNGAISEEEWETMLDPSNFENYTVDLQGNMTVRVNGVTQTENYPVHTVCRVTENAVEVVIIDGDNEASVVLTGDEAEVQKTESSQLFLIILGGYEDFEYDEKTGEYIIPNKMIETNITTIVNGETAEKIPVAITVKSGRVKLSDGGKIAKLTCEYSQKMELAEGQTTVTEGNTTWTFSNFGTTVVNA